MFGSVSQMKIKKDTGGIALNHSTHAPGRADVESIVNKLQKLPQYSRSSRIEKLRLASKLTSSSDMTQYFSEYLNDRDSLVETEQNAEAKQCCSDKQQLIESLSDFCVKLHITSQLEESTHVSLQVDSQLIEWTPQNIIIPHNNIPAKTLDTIDLSQCIMKTLLSQEAQIHYDGSSEVDDLAIKLRNARRCMVEHVVKQIIIFNRYYYYQAGTRDSQNFAKNLLAALGIDTLPPLTKAVVLYLESDKDATLKKHKELDDYTLENTENMSSGEMEYIALMYYKCHLTLRAKADDLGSEMWKCPEERCQLRSILLKLIK